MSESVVFGRYRLIEEIGRGGTGVVWRATDTVLGQQVALKRVSLGGLAGADAEERRERTMREARLAAQLRGHPNVVAVYDVVADAEDVWLVLEYVPARSLAQLLTERGRLPVPEAAAIGVDIAHALAAAHAQGIVHRDVSPGNVLIGADGRAKLTDFGISRADAEPRVTRTGAVSGTVAYLAPEVANTGESGPESDVYSLGSTVYSAVEGLPPFGSSENTFKLLNLVRTGMIRPPEGAGPMTPLLMRLLQLDPITRPDAPTARESFRALSTGAAAPPAATTAPPSGGLVTVPPGGMPVRRRTRTGPLLAGAAVLLVAALIAVLAIALPNEEPGRAQAAPAAPTLPRTAPNIAAGDDVQTISLCPLVDAAALRRFGAVTVQRGYKLADCDVLVQPPGNAVPRTVDLGLKGLVSSWDEVGGTRSDIGGLKLFRRAFVKDHDCRDSIGLADMNVIDIEAYQLDTPTPQLCQLVRTITDGAMTRLARHGLPRDDSVLQYQLAHIQACSVLDAAALRRIPKLAAREENERSDHWYCSWGFQQRGQAFVRAEFDLATTRQETDPGYADTTVAGVPAHIEGKPGERNDRACQADVLHSRQPGRRTEILRVWLDAPGDDDGLCAAVRRLADTAERRAVRAR